MDEKLLPERPKTDAERLAAGCTLNTLKKELGPGALRRLFDREKPDYDMRSAARWMKAARIDAEEARQQQAKAAVKPIAGFVPASKSRRTCPAREPDAELVRLILDGIQGADGRLAEFSLRLMIIPLVEAVLCDREVRVDTLREASREALRLWHNQGVALEAMLEQLCMLPDDGAMGSAPILIELLGGLDFDVEAQT